MMRTIMLLMGLVLTITPVFAQADKMKTTQDEDNFFFIEEKTNTRTHSPLLKRDGTPHPRWQKFGFECVNGYNPTYRALKEVLTPQQINTLAARGEKMSINSIFDLNGNVMEVCFLFYKQEPFDAISTIITLDQFYAIAQKVKQYEKYIITEFLDEIDVQWLGAKAIIDFKKVRDWNP